MSEANECRVYVGNLPFSMGFQDLKELFTSCGEVVESTVVVNKYTGRSKGFGFITFANAEAAQKAIKEFDSKEVNGRNLKVNIARPMEKRDGINAEPKEETKPKESKPEEPTPETKTEENTEDKKD